MLELAQIRGGHTFEAIDSIENQNKKVMSVERDAAFNRQMPLEQSLQLLKMQSLEVFASRIAHDFNNIFAVILASSSMIEMNKINAEKSVEGLKAIKNAVGRGAELIGQVLTFAGKMELSLKPTSIPTLIDDHVAKLRSIFPSNIHYRTVISENVPFISADQDKIQQLLMSICSNARDAMPDGGTLTIKVDRITGQELQKQYSNANQELYVSISISDTGNGIEETIRNKIFDPFFTTKGKGKRSGMGLSLVYGIAEAHAGFIDLRSETGKGSTFYLYFPVTQFARQTQNISAGNTSDGKKNTESILIVEDEKCLLDLARIMLESKGYKVFTARDGLEGLEVYKQHQKDIALVFTDIGLPGLNGREMFKKLKELDSQVKVIFTSGIFVDIKDALLKDGAKDFIPKPYKQDEILKKMREVLDAPVLQEVQ